MKSKIFSTEQMQGIQKKFPDITIQELDELYEKLVGNNSAFDDNPSSIFGDRGWRWSKNAHWFYEQVMQFGGTSRQLREAYVGTDPHPGPLAIHESPGPWILHKDVKVLKTSTEIFV